MNRTDAREFAMKMLYQIDLNSELKEKNLHEYLNAKKLGEQLDYMTTILHHYNEDLALIDEEINSNSKNWKTNRLPKIDLAILRLAIIEIKYLEDVPKSVAINEAVNLAKKYSTDESKGFVNAVLANIN